MGRLICKSALILVDYVVFGAIIMASIGRVNMSIVYTYGVCAESKMCPHAVQVALVAQHMGTQ